MNVQIKSKDDQLYRPPPGYALGKSAPPGKSGDIEQLDVEALCKAISSARLKSLRMKQNVMEAFMRKLLQSMKELKEIEQKKGKSALLDKQRRLKLTRMLQILMLQRRNLQLQTDTLQRGIIILSKKYSNIRKRVDCLISENTLLYKDCNQLKSDNEFKTIQIDNLLQNKSILQKQMESHTTLKIQEENIQYELKRVKVENENLKDALKQLEILLRNKVQEREDLELRNIQLQQEIDSRNAEETNIRVRNERLMSENQLLRQKLTHYQAERTDVSLLNLEADKIREKFTHLQREYLKLQHLYTVETETRKILHNQLQEVRGNLKVLCRCRPSTNLNDSYVLRFHSLDRIIVSTTTYPNVATYQRQTSIELTNMCIPKEETFTFNRVFRPSATQIDVFEEIRALIASCIDGYNVCIMAYGPTGSGKTYTMQGLPKDPGVSVRAVTELFELCQPLQSIWKVQVSMAMLEIHNEVVYDLLGEQIKPVKLSDDGVDIRLIEAEEKIATNEHDMICWIAKGNKRRKVTATKLNVESSRSHHIIRLQLTLCNNFDKTKRHSSLILCDLAGSESADRIEASGEVHAETGYINKSLVTLTRVFEAHRRRNQSLRPGVYNSHLVTAPYRDSKLTHILKPCLGGQAKCVLIITVSGEPGLIDRNIRALEFGQKAMQISLGAAHPNEKILTSWFGKTRVKSTEPNPRHVN
ncbi:unnamed protein product [Heterobilharzia americana]|nr:unnamed protein product [Heterobilharzia americana]